MSSTAPSFWTKTLVYLGLWEEEESYADVQESAPVEHQGEPTFAHDRTEGHRGEPVAARAVDAPREPARQDSERPAPRRAGNVRPLRLAPAAPQPRTEIVRVDGFDDCEAIGRLYRDGTAVLFELAAVDRTTARRVIDFVSGATFVLEGSLTRVASRAFLLVPEGVTVADEERDRLEARGYRLADGA